MRRACLVAVVFACGGTLFAERIAMKTDWASCAVETDGARIVSFKGPDGEEVLWNDDPVQLRDADWAHGGIPICWPWYGRNKKGVVHGTVWKSPFAVAAREERKDRSELVLVRTEGDVRLEYTIVLRDTLKLELKTENRGTSDFTFSAAFHPYFRVGERDRTQVGGVTDSLIAVDHALDDGYPARPGSCSIYRLHDPTLDRTTSLFAENSTNVNIWNPGAKKDCPGTVPGESWRQFVCVEPTLGHFSKPVTLKPGAFVTLMMGVDVRRGAKTTRREEER